MGTEDRAVTIDLLERRLLPDSTPNEDSEDVDTILYSASFEEVEDNYIKYQTARWILYSLPLILAWGIGVLMLLYLPVRRYILRKDFQSRKLYVTPNAIIYKVTRPVAFPCLGVLKKEKHMLLPSVADVIVEQGYLQSMYGIYSVRIENARVRRPSSDDVQIQGIAHPRAFKRAVLTRLSSMLSGSFTQKLSASEDTAVFGSAQPPAPWIYPSGSLVNESLSPSEELILQKLEEVGSSVKRVHTLIEARTQSAAVLD